MMKDTYFDKLFEISDAEKLIKEENENFNQIKLHKDVLNEKCKNKHHKYIIKEIGWKSLQLTGFGLSPKRQIHQLLTRYSFRIEEFNKNKLLYSFYTDKLNKIEKFRQELLPEIDKPFSNEVIEFECIASSFIKEYKDRNKKYTEAYFRNALYKMIIQVLKKDYQTRIKELNRLLEIYKEDTTLKKKIKEEKNKYDGRDKNIAGNVKYFLQENFNIEMPTNIDKKLKKIAYYDLL